MVICAGHTPQWCFQAPQVAAKGDAYVATILDRIFLHSVCSGLSSFIDTGATTSIMSKFGIIFVILFTAHAMCYCSVFTCPGHTHTLAESACTQSGYKYMISSEPSCLPHALAGPAVAMVPRVPIVERLHCVLSCYWLLHRLAADLSTLTVPPWDSWFQLWSHSLMMDTSFLMVYCPWAQQTYLLTWREV